MFNKFEDFETLFLVLFGFSFHIIENLMPSRENKRKENIKNDLIAFVVLAVSVNISRLAWNSFFSIPAFANLLAFFSPLWSLHPVVKIIGALLTLDLCLYWLHRAMHVNRTLWKTHEWHHSPSHLYWFSGYRTSFMHAFLYAIPQIFIAFYLFKLSFVEIIWVASIGVLFQVWTHANITVKLGFFEKLIITPQYHRLHHSRGKMMKTNYGVFVPWWDMMFGSYENPESHPAEYPLGVKAARPLWRSLLGL